MLARARLSGHPPEARVGHQDGHVRNRFRREGIPPGEAAKNLSWLVLSHATDISGNAGSATSLADNDFRLLKSTLDSHKGISHVLFAGGSPCQGFSRANLGGKGVRDLRSAPIWVFHALPAAAMSHLGDRASVAVLLENVIMQEPAVTGKITKLLGTFPQRAYANLWTAGDRDRTFWSSYPESPLPGIED